MAVETATNISQLNPLWPQDIDQEAEGAGHIRVTKLAIIDTFPNVTATVNPTAVEFNRLVGVTADLQPQLDLKAPLASPALTGTPTAPTAAPGTVGTQIASVDFVNNAAFSAALPDQAGNAGAHLKTDGTTAIWELAISELKGADIASASTINLTTATGNFLHITGTTNITTVTLVSGSERVVIFDGILTLVHNATTNNLPGGANIVTAAGDKAIYRGDGSVVRLMSYDRADGSLTPPAAINELRGPDIASAATLSGIWASAQGNDMGVTGTTTTTSFGTAPQAGVKRNLFPAAAWPLTASANISIPGIVSGVTITTGAGWRLEVIALTTTTYLVNVFKADGSALASTTLPYLIAKYQVAANTVGGAGSSGAAITGIVRPLNTLVKNTITGATLSSNLISLPAGTYRASGRLCAGNSGNTKVRAVVYNETDSAALIIGTSGLGPETVNVPVNRWSEVQGPFVLAATKNVSLRIFADGFSGGTSEMGNVTNIASQDEVYAVIEIWKEG